MGSQSLLSAILGIIATYGVVAVVLYVLLVVAQWKIFTKAGEAGWKSLIPGLNMYIQFKIAWGSMYFWIWILAIAVGAGLSSVDNSFCGTLGSLVTFASTVILWISNIKLAQSFRKGIGFGIGLILIPNLFTLILGLDKSKYHGPVTK